MPGHSDGCKTPSDGLPISSGTLAGDLGGITICNPWSNESDANLEDSACTVLVLLFFPIGINDIKTIFSFSVALKSLVNRYVEANATLLKSENLNRP